ncbi:MAG TPA: CoA-binding protein, partial [Anaerolineaceae bacterium]|nr:CoA-binding protein [Anaerolineaceae bacterium]
MTDDSLTPFFRPRGIVVIGASREPTKLGYGMARNLVLSGYTGAIHFVNPNGGELFGRPIYTDVQAVPDPVDLAVILTPAPTVAGVLRQCGGRGIRGAIVSSGGFRETGPAGAALERELGAVAEEFGLRFIGPNCVGMMDLHLPFDTTFLQPPAPPAGDVAFVS